MKKEKKRIVGLTPPHPKRENEACVTREVYRGMWAETVIGTFKNGSFHGPGKVIFEDGRFQIRQRGTTRRGGGNSS